MRDVEPAGFLTSVTSTLLRIHAVFKLNLFVCSYNEEISACEYVLKHCFDIVHESLKPILIIWC